MGLLSFETAMTTTMTTGIDDTDELCTFTKGYIYGHTGSTYCTVMVIHHVKTPIGR